VTALSLPLTALSLAMKCSTTSADESSPAAMRPAISRADIFCSSCAGGVVAAREVAAGVMKNPGGSFAVP